VVTEEEGGQSKKAKKKTRDLAQQELSDMAKRANQKAGDTEKVGVPGIGCIHCGMEQRCMFVIHIKAKHQILQWSGTASSWFGVRWL
jgi:hypothetical protein